MTLAGVPGCCLHLRDRVLLLDHEDRPVRLVQQLLLRRADHRAAQAGDAMDSGRDAILLCEPCARVGADLAEGGNESGNHAGHKRAYDRETYSAEAKADLVEAREIGRQNDPEQRRESSSDRRSHGAADEADHQIFGKNGADEAP